MRRFRRATVVRAPRGASREAFLDAAYRMTDRAWVRVDERAGRLAAVLIPRGAAKGLAREFRAALENAAALRRAGPAARRLRAAVAARALELAARPGGARDQSPLPPERLAEIVRLVAEDEAAPRDPLGLRVPWEELRRGAGPA